MYISRLHTDSDVSNFTLAENGDFPWHATIIIKYTDNTMTPYPSYFSGVILNEKWIIAPAKVIENAHSIRVDVGTVNITEPMLSVYPDAYTLHPEFDGNKYENNIALLRLSGDNVLDYTKRRAKFSPIRLPQRRQFNESFVGFAAYISSYKFSQSSTTSCFPFAFCWF